MEKIIDLNKYASGSSFSGYYLNVSLNELIEKLGQPSHIGSGDNKVQLEWFYEDGEKMLTIYDYKSGTPINQIFNWHIGRKLLNENEIITFFKEHGFNSSQLIKEEQI